LLIWHSKYSVILSKIHTWRELESELNMDYKLIDIKEKRDC